MRDYKFRQSNLSFREPKRTGYKRLLRIAVLVFVVGALYGFVQLGLSWYRASEAPEASRDGIPLPLPPHAEPAGDTRPVSSDPGSPAEAPIDRVFTGKEKVLQSEVQAESTTRSNTARLSNGYGTWIEHEVEPGDTLSKIFEDNDLSPQLLERILGSGKEANLLKTIRPEERIRIHLDRERQFSELHLQLDELRSVKFTATNKGIKGTEIRKETQTKAAMASGVIEHSLFASAGKKGIPDPIIMQLAKIFGWDIDFALEIRPGDRFAVIYEELWADGKQVGADGIIAAEFVNQGRAHRAVRFKDSRGKTDYYSPDGMPLRKTFFRTPVEFTRISSGFSNRRWHPVLKRWRAHKGVDYAAPSGTPIIATGDGRVEFRGRKRGYGRIVEIRHNSKYKTVYGHMSRFARGLSKGDQVKQGEVIGYVGQSGLATGPHLHYEFQVNGVQRNPLTVKAPMAEPLPREDLEKFRKIASPLLASLEQTASDTMVADTR